MKEKTEAKNQEIRNCKKCQRPLPEGYKHKYCENCRNEHAEIAKKGIIGVAGFVLSAGLFVVSAGKFGGMGGKDS